MNTEKFDAARRQYSRDIGKANRAAAKALRKGADRIAVSTAREQAMADARAKRDRAVRDGKPALRQSVKRSTFTSRAVLARIGDEVRAMPKEPRLENPHLLAMAEGGSCLFLWDEDCRGTDGSTSVQCHENTLNANKGTGIKAHDFRSARGCIACHTAYDQGSALFEVKQTAFAIAFGRQLAEWHSIVADPLRKPKDRAAAAWALDHWAKSSLGAIHV